EDDTHIEGKEVAPGQLVLAGEPVDDHRVRRRADRTGEAAVALECGLSALRSDELLGGLVELPGRDPRAGLRLQHREAACQHASGGGHFLDLVGRLARNHTNQRRASSGMAVAGWPATARPPAGGWRGWREC